MTKLLQDLYERNEKREGGGESNSSGYENMDTRKGKKKAIKHFAQENSFKLVRIIKNRYFVHKINVKIRHNKP